MSVVIAQVIINDASSKTITGVITYDRPNGGTLVMPQGTAFPVTPVTGEVFYRTDLEQIYRWNGAAWQPEGGVGIGGNLDSAYDFGGPGAGRQINVDTGLPVQFTSSGGENAIELTGWVGITNQNFYIGGGSHGVPGTRAIGIGFDASATGDNGIALGHGATANQLSGIAIGVGASVTANNQAVIGGSTGVITSLVLGNGSESLLPTATVTIRGTSAVAGSGAAGTSLQLRGGLGDGAGADGVVEFLSAVQSGSGVGTSGQVLTSQGPGSVPIWTTISTVTSLQDAYDNGNAITLTASTPVAVTATGVGESAISVVTGIIQQNPVAIGVALSQGATNSISIGSSATGSGVNSVAIGTSTIASQVSAIAVGAGAIADAQSSIAIGDTAVVALGADTAMALGLGAIASNVGSVALGPAALDAVPGELAANVFTRVNLGSAELYIGATPGSGTAGQVLTSQGAGQSPEWTTLTSGGVTLQTAYDNGDTITTTAGNPVTVTATAVNDPALQIALGYIQQPNADGHYVWSNTGPLFTTGRSNISIGSGHTWAGNFDQSVCVGLSNSLLAPTSGVPLSTIVIGQSNIVRASSSVAIGNGVSCYGAGGSSADTLGDDNIVIGRSTYCEGSDNTVIGVNARCGSDSSVILGESATNELAGTPGTFGQDAVAVGRAARAAGSNTTSIGVNSTTSDNASDAIALGSVAQALAVETIAIGFGAKALAARSICIGTDSFGVAASAGGTDSIVIGSGGSTTTKGAIAIGRDADGLGSDTVAIGSVAIASGRDSIAIGKSTNATGNEAIAIGDSTLTTGLSAISIGQGAAVSAQSAVAIGSGTSALGNRSVVIGLNSSNSSGDAAIAIGDTAVAGAAQCIAIGDGAAVNGVLGIAIGQASVSGADGIAIGAGMVSGDNQGAIGSSQGITKFGFGRGITSATTDANVLIHATNGTGGANGSNLQLRGGLGATNGYVELLSALQANSSIGSAGDVLTSRGTGLSPEWAPPFGGTSIVETSAATYNVLATDNIVLSGRTSTGTQIVNLPAGAASTGLVTIKDAANNASVNAIVINPDGSETIDGQSSYVINQDGNSVTLAWANSTSTWHVI